MNCAAHDDWMTSALEELPVHMLHVSSHQLIRCLAGLCPRNVGRIFREVDHVQHQELTSCIRLHEAPQMLSGIRGNCLGIEFF